MKVENLNSRNVEASTGFVENTKSFGVKDPAIIFDILCNRMYKQPLRTAVQEYLCNARDAHREVGKDDVPITVSVPSSLSPNFSVRDYGPGISPERMNEVFLYLGESTKRDSNLQTGGFGVGAKIGWAYVDSFTIITIVDGTKFTYLAYLGEDGIGRLTLVSAEESDEPQGTEIVFPIRSEDIWKVEDYVKEITCLWNPRPEGNIDWGDDLEPLHPSVLSRGNVVWFSQVPRGYRDLFLINGRNHKRCIVLDGIPYMENWYGEGDQVPVDCFVFCDTGDVSVAVNREGLRWSSEQKELVKGWIADAVKKCVARNEEFTLDVKTAIDIKDIYDICMKHKNRVFPHGWKTKTVLMNQYNTEGAFSFVVATNNLEESRIEFTGLGINQVRVVKYVGRGTRSFWPIEIPIKSLVSWEHAKDKWVIHCREIHGPVVKAKIEKFLEDYPGCNLHIAFVTVRAYKYLESWGFRTFIDLPGEAKRKNPQKSAARKKVIDRDTKIRDLEGYFVSVEEWERKKREGWLLYYCPFKGMKKWRKELGKFLAFSRKKTAVLVPTKSEVKFCVNHLGAMPIEIFAKEHAVFSVNELYARLSSNVERANRFLTFVHRKATQKDMEEPFGLRPESLTHGVVRSWDEFNELPHKMKEFFILACITTAVYSTTYYDAYSFSRSKRFVKRYDQRVEGFRIKVRNKKQALFSSIPLFKVYLDSRYSSYWDKEAVDDLVRYCKLVLEGGGVE